MYINRVNVFNINVMRKNVKKKCFCEFSSVIKESIELMSMFFRVLAQIFKDSNESHATLIMAILFLYCFKN